MYAWVPFENLNTLYKLGKTVHTKYVPSKYQYALGKY